ncbi:MAG: J domain-containing protein, partial [Desulfobacterales bacterium]
MYLAQKVVRGKTQYFIRETYREGKNLLSRNVLDLGTDPSRYIVYPGGNAFYIDEVITDKLSAGGTETAYAELEDIFWRFLKPEIRRVLEPFRRREKLTRKRRRPQPPAEHYGGPFHIFDKRRIHFLKFGGMEQGSVGCLPPKFFRMLVNKSRDEIEQN